MSNHEQQKVSDRKVKVAFDIDDTLWKVRIREVNGRKTGDQVPDYDLIQVLRWFHANDHEVYVWSAGGVDYAQQIVDKLGLTEMVTVIPKAKTGEIGLMDIAFDDADTQIARVDVKVKRPNYDSM